MKKGVLLIVLLILLFLHSAFASGGIVCNSSDPTKIVVYSYNVGDGNFQISLANGLGKDINIVSVSSGQMIIAKSPIGLVGTGELIKISGTYPATDYVNSQISIAYLTEQDKKEVTIACRGSDPYNTAQRSTGYTAFLGSTIFFFISSLIAILYGYKKREPAIRAVGILLFLFFLLSLILMLIPVPFY